VAAGSGVSLYVLAKCGSPQGLRAFPPIPTQAYEYPRHTKCAGLLVFGQRKYCALRWLRVFLGVPYDFPLHICFFFPMLKMAYPRSVRGRGGDGGPFFSPPFPRRETENVVGEMCVTKKRSFSGGRLLPREMVISQPCPRKVTPDVGG